LDEVEAFTGFLFLLLIPTKREDAFAHNYLEISFFALLTNEPAVNPDCEQAIGS
jgi:hypothetical protein